MTKSSLILSGLMLMAVAVFSQVDRGGEPISWNIEQQVSQSSIWNLLPSIDLNVLLEEDSWTSDDKSLPMRYATAIPTQFSEANSGKWTNLHNGDRIWMLGIESSEAYSLGITFSNFNLPEGAKLFVYSENHTDYLGPLTHRDNRLNQTMTLPPVNGSKIIIEYYEPYAYRGDGEFNIVSVAHGYRNLKDPSIQTEYPCMEELEISPVNNSILDASSSVLMMIVDNGQRIATATLINNSSNDGTPYVVTAQSAMMGLPISWVFLFDVAGTGCYNDNSICWSRAICGAQVLETDNAHGVTLLRLRSNPDKNWTAYYSGWNINELDESQQVLSCIQNSFGLPQSIAEYAGSVQAMEWKNKTVYKFPDWSFGQTFKGSIGSPVFDMDMNLIGIYIGGSGNCEEEGTEYFASIKSTWNNFEEFLNPLSIESDRIEGIYPIIPQGNDEEDKNEIFFFPNPAQEWIYIQNRSEDQITQVEIRDAQGRIVLISKPIVPTLDIQSLPEGLYVITIFQGNTSTSQKLLVR